MCHFTKYVVKNIFVVLLSLLDSKLCNSMDPKSNFLLSVVQTMKKCVVVVIQINHIKADHPRYTIVYISTADSGNIYEKHMPRWAI